MIERKIGRSSDFKASLAEIDHFCGDVNVILRQLGLQRYIFSIQLLLREALTNAVVHGSSRENGGIIHALFLVNDSYFTIEVEDNGPGFDWKNSPKEVIGSLDVSGRGQWIIQSYASEVIYNDKGNKITIKKDLGRGGSDMADISGSNSEGNKIIIMEKAGDVLNAAIKTDFVASVCDSVKAALKDAIDDTVKKVIFDFENVVYVDSMAIGVIIATHNTMSEKGGSIEAVNLSPEVMGLFKAMQLHRHFNLKGA